MKKLETIDQTIDRIIDDNLLIIVKLKGKKMKLTNKQKQAIREELFLNEKKALELLHKIVTNDWLVDTVVNPADGEEVPTEKLWADIRVARRMCEAAGIGE